MSDPTTIERPALAHTLAALTDGHVARYADVESVQALGPITRPGYGCWPWSVETPAEAVEVLHTRDLWPWSPGDDAAPQWWCEQCEGSGLDPRVRLYRKPCAERCDWGTAADPPSFPALVAVASLGADALRTAEGLGLQLVGRAPRIVWRVMAPSALRKHHEATRAARRASFRIDASNAVTLPEVFAVEATLTLWSTPVVWRAGSPQRAAWPALHDLHALGLRLVGLDGDRVTLAVETIGGDR